MSRAVDEPAVPLPQGLRELLLLKVPAAKLNDWALEAIVVEAAREHIISRRKSAELMGLTSSAEREAFFDRHGLTNEYTAEMVEEDFRAIEHLEAIRRAG